jgi:hypothetical protein
MSSAKRVLTVNLHRKLYPADKVLNNINYLGSDLQLTDSDVADIISKLPEFWNTGKDCLIKFVYFEDGTYMCQRQKEVYNYSLRETEQKIYFFDIDSKQQVNNLVSFFSEFYGKAKLEKIDNIYDEILRNISDFSFVKFNLLETRKKLLAESDYMMLQDYPLSEEEKIKWSEFRQQLRDITKQEAWINNDLVNVIMPTSPEPRYQLSELFKNLDSLITDNIPPNILQKFHDKLVGIGVENVIKRFSETTLKLEVINGLSKIGLPFAISDGESLSINKLFSPNIKDILPEIEETEIDVYSEKVISKWQQYLTDIDNKIDQINNQLSSYNIDFTIGDIIKEVSEHTKNKLDQIDAEEKVEELINDLHIETMYEEYGQSFVDNMIQSMESTESEGEN